MPKLKLTKTAADAARPETVPCELRDTNLPGFSLKVTPTGRKIFMVANVANDGQRHKPARGRIGEITVEQAHGIAQDWLRRGQIPASSAPPRVRRQRSRSGSKGS
jgi:hypothetical protein